MSGLDYFLGNIDTIKTGGGFTPGIADKTLVRYIIYNEGVSKRGSDILTQMQAAEKEKLETVGIANEAILAMEHNYKNCGIEYNVAITHAYNPSTNVWEEIMPDGKLPDFINTSRLEYIPFNTCVKAIEKLGMKYLSNMFKMAVEDGSTAIRIGYQPFFPLSMKDNQKEKERLDQVTKIINGYNSVDEEMALNGIKRAAARKLVLYKTNADGYPVFYNPEIGMYGHAMLKISKGSYFNLDAFGYNPDLPGKSKEEVYVLGHHCILSTDESKALASNILGQIEVKKAEKAKNEVEMVEEEPVF